MGKAMIDKAEREAASEAAGETELKPPDWSSLDPKNLEATRALRKKVELQQKLKARREADAPPLTAEDEAAAKARTAELASEAIKVIEEANQPKPESLAPKVKIGDKMMVTSEGTMSKDESTRLQAAVGAGKSSKLKAFYQLENQEPREITESDVADDEVDACERMNLVVNTKIGTLQVERCSKMAVVVPERENFSGFLIWAGCFMLRVQVADLVMSCDFGLTQKLDPTINQERTQFKVWLNALGKLCCDKVIRLKNGFPTTKREDDEHTRREEQKLDDLAKRMGITIHRKEDAIGGRVKPNEPCPCGSGQKFKKCCQNGTLKVSAEQAASGYPAEKK